MKFRSLLATLAVVFSLLFAACEVPSGIILGEDDVTFDITISDVTSSGATVNVVPSDKTVLYYFDKVEKSTYEAYKSDDDFMKKTMTNLREYVSSSGGALFSALSVGETDHTFSNELRPDTDYYIFAFAIDSKLNPTSKLSLKEFTTEAVKMSNNTFEVSVNGGVITVTPSNNDTYFWSVEPSDLYEGQSDDYIMNDLISYYDSEGYLDYYLAVGVSSFDYTTLLTAGDSFTVYVFGYEGTPTTALTQHTFTYGSGSGSGSGSGDSTTTTLTGDVTLNVASIEAYYYGDYYDIGTNNWEIGFFDKTGFEFIYSEFFTTLGVNSPEGTFTIKGNAGDAYTAFSGAIEEGNIYPTYYVKFDANEKIEAFALIAAGNFSIEKKSGSNYGVNINLSDILGNKVSGSYEGAMTIAEGELESSQASVRSRANRRAAHSALRRFSSAALIQPAVTAPSRVMRTK